MILDKSDVLLVGVNAKFTHTNPAIRYLKAYARSQAGIHVDIVEYTINHNYQFVLRDIVEKNPKVVCFSIYIWNVEFIIDIAKALKNVVPGIIIVFGGPEVSFDPDSDAYSVSDFVVSGEGEAGFLKVIEAIESESFKERIIKGCREVSLDDIPFIYDDIDSLSNRTIYYESSRGCPFNCSYCLSSATRGVRFASLDKVKKDLKILLDKRAMQVKFVDRTFNANPLRALEIMEFVSENDNGFTNFHFEITATILEERTFEFLKTVRKGLIQFEIGLQSSNTDTVDEIGRKVDSMETLEKCKRVVEIGNTHIHLDLIAGLPYEGFDLFLNSIDAAFSAFPDMLQLGFLKMLKGSRIRAEGDKHGYKFYHKAPYEVLSNNYLSFAELMKIKDIEEIIEITYNAGFLNKTLRCMSQTIFKGSMSNMILDISTYFRNTGFFAQPRKRDDIVKGIINFIRYKLGHDILIEFVIFDAAVCGVKNISQFEIVDFQGFDEYDREKLHKALATKEVVSSLAEDFENIKPRDILKQTMSFKVQYDIIKYMDSGFRTIELADEASYDMNNKNSGSILIVAPQRGKGRII